ncbi:OmpH family outer membrane protein [Ferruginibacter sp. HRS2-29]|uniref:OmpH family outer membrane protein n=1 Tax=Ferruginibacter sp. HRS2-29 TaxID=2487334 RepID=UPI0020CF5858|nr:OmpH family outer membrane protein [Ferruginibacter sp. HRS2-29]MCP9750721.1 OmpH family outer membrane protein [Ferruginibacter sp. HRS2-29]
MKNLSLVLNIVLLAAVAFLYYHVFGGKSSVKNTPVKTAAAGDNGVVANRAPIAYVELDSLNEKITYIKDKRKALEGEQKEIERQWQVDMKGLENQRDNFLKRGASITQEEAEKFQGQLYQQQQQIEAKKQSAGQRLSQQSYEFMDDIQKKLKEFLNDYNKEKNYMYILTSGTGLDYMVYKDSTLNITSDVIKGMNEKLSKKP